MTCGAMFLQCYNMGKGKVTRVGNSAGIIVPRDLLRELDLKVGTPIELGIEKGALVIRRSARKERLRIDPMFAKRVDDFIRKYKPALDELAK